MELGVQDENRTHDLRITSALEANECGHHWTQTLSHLWVRSRVAFDGTAMTAASPRHSRQIIDTESIHVRLTNFFGTRASAGISPESTAPVPA